MKSTTVSACKASKKFHVVVGIYDAKAPMLFGIFEEYFEAENEETASVLALYSVKREHDKACLDDASFAESFKNVVFNVITVEHD